MVHRAGFLLTMFLVALVHFPAKADVRTKRVCLISSDFPSARGSSTAACYSGRICRVGVRGDWLDLTDRVSIEGEPPSATISIFEKGVGDGRGAIGNSTCVPESSRSREGYISMHLTNIRGTGPMSIKMSRPNAFGGRDHDTITVTVKNGTSFVSAEDDFRATVNVLKTLRLDGGNLDQLQLRNPGPSDRIVSRNETEATVEMLFTQTGTFNLKDRLQIAGAEPVINADHGWPQIVVARATAGQAPAPPPPTTSRPPTSSGSSLPNLTPSVVFPTRPLLRKINTLASTMIPPAFCTGFANNEEREVAVPDFVWAVSTSGSVPGQFLNTVDGSAVLGTQQTGNITGNDIRPFSNWPGRPTRVRVVKVTGPPLFAQYQNSAGCYLTNATAASVRLDPSPIIIRVDSANQIQESNELDNETRTN